MPDPNNVEIAEQNSILLSVCFKADTTVLDTDYSSSRCLHCMHCNFIMCDNQFLAICYNDRMLIKVELFSESKSTGIAAFCLRHNHAKPRYGLIIPIGVVLIHSVGEIWHSASESTLLNETKISFYRCSAQKFT